MKNNSIMMTVVVALIVGAVAFFGGMQYQKSQRATGANGQFAGTRNGQGGFGGFAGRTGTNQGVRPINGEILSQDDTSVTVKMQDGSSKIVILSDKTTINKATTGSKTDLKTGERISAFGTTNSDGSVTAQMISVGGMMFRGNGGPQGGSITPSPVK